MVGVAWHCDGLRAHRREEVVVEEIAGRTAELTRCPWPSHERLEIPPNWWSFWCTLGLTLLGGPMVMLGFDAPIVSWPPLLAGAAFLALGALTLPTVLASVGKPALVLDRKGLKTPVDGEIPWSAVEGVFLQVLEHRGEKTYSLFFHVPTYAEVVPRVHWGQRWLAMFRLGALCRGQISVSLRAGKERPETIEAVARFLWKSATGRAYDWNPNVSAACNEASRQLATLLAAMEHPTNLERDFRERPAHAIARADAEIERMAQVRQQFEVIDSEQKKMFHKLKWRISLLALAGICVALIWPWVMRNLSG